ncbi:MULTISPECIES: UDP-4-amino-4,6-dideoxy-N-acetyl-beta-L-altrosamine N-acetyltransferase [Pseudomonas]|uniref:UDP-4-amino-4, 6-dideoxy-N-acetyl-beta-L-altrosamine N-acetyltransferase n=1 Tax=Pseudomonas nitroreducens TaxID=46680 RepID=UPI001F0D2F2C|nr:MULTISPECIES: UDP-4-amino-4,6-dideoxy-N-acetyl-beta-L-altrosamine N-acetyltransferase [Pseudomonas]
MGKLRLLTEPDLPLLLDWRNDPAINRYMFNQRPIQLAEHIQWFCRAAQDPKYTLLIYENNSTPLGHINFTEKPDSGIAEWGFYIAPDAPRGTGSSMCTAALRMAFLEIKLRKISAQVLAYNERSLHLHQKLGFQQEGVLRDQHFDGNHYHSIHCFGLLAQEWQK